MPARPAASLKLPVRQTRRQRGRVLPGLAAAFDRALERGQQVAATSRAAMEQALIPALHISKTTAATMALGTFPLSIDANQLQRVAILMQENGLLASSTRPAALVGELVSG
jgi:NitT/TauT family transport system substrate-binding protein